MAAMRIKQPAGWAFRKIIYWISGSESSISSSPTDSAGAGAPTTTDEPKGSTYRRTDGTGNNELFYVYNGSAWVAMSAVS
mgnify:CR=1 FL=1